MMGVSFTLPSMWDSMIFPLVDLLIIKLVINQQVASSCEWLGEDHLEKGGPNMFPTPSPITGHLTPHTLKDHKPHGTHPWAPRQPRWAAMCCCPWQPRPASPASPALACGLLLLLASTPSMLVRAVVALCLGLAASKQWPSPCCC